MIKDNKKVAWTLYFLTGKHDGDAHVVAQVAQLYQTAICEGDYMVLKPDVLAHLMKTWYMAAKEKTIDIEFIKNV